MHTQRFVYSSKRAANHPTLEQIVERLSKGWMPANPAIVEKIREGLDNGNYDLDPEFLLNDLKGDVSLLLFCMRELIRSSPRRAPGDPMDTLRRADIDEVKRLFPRDATMVSSFHLEDAEPLQVSRLQEAMLSASTAEVLAEHNDLDPSLGFCAGIIRQFGLILIAWNYPDAYQNACEMTENGKPLDLAISQTLGFSPETLAIALVREWQLGESIERIVVKAPARGTIVNQERGASEDPAAAIAELCHIGELLARANDPERYPTAKRDWDRVRALVQEQLGRDGLQRIKDQYNENCASYCQAFPETFVPLNRLDPETRIKVHDNHEILRNNNYVQHCPPTVRKRLTELYESMSNAIDSQDAMRVLVKEILPLAGYSGGIVYTFDPQLNALMPRLRYGDPQLRGFQPVSFRHEITADEAIRTAFECQTPIMESISVGSSTPLSYTAAVLGISRRVGVLYLEAPRSTGKESVADPLTMFKAIRQTVNDALRLQ